MTAASTPSPFRAFYRVYWEDTDATGIVYHANHLRWFERARTDWLRALGFDQEALRRDHAIGFVVADAVLHWQAPARLDDLLAVSVTVQRPGAASLQLAQAIARVGHDGDTAPGTPIASARIRIGCVDLGTFRPARVPDRIVAALATAGVGPAADLQKNNETPR